MVDQLVKSLDIGREECVQIVRKITEDMDRCITKSPCCLNMINSFVSKLPTGKETGKFMAVDIGGTNLRVQMFECGGSCRTLASQKFTITDHIKISNKHTLFNYIAQCIQDFLASNKGFESDTTPIPMGFTFSYPIHHLGLRSGLLLRWTKEMDVEGVVGGDVVKMLEEALVEKNLNLKVEALVNDTIGTLVSSAFEDQDTYVGIVNGTGSNLCYVDANEKTLFNVEFGSFGSGQGKCMEKHLNFVDALIDQQSANPGQQIIEKTISGRYLGEVLRQVLIQVFRKGGLFQAWRRGLETQGLLTDGGEGKEGFCGLSTQHALTTEMMASIEGEPSNSSSETTKVLAMLGVEGVTKEDVAMVKRLCGLVSARAAKFLAAGITAAVLKVDKPKVTLAYEGSVVQSYPRFKETLLEQINLNLAGKIQVSLRKSEDGSGRGAALVAASNRQL